MNKKGFTLIELLIVVAIIAILAAIAVPNFLEAQVRAKVSRQLSNMRTTQVAIELYMVDHNKLPVTTQNGPGAGGLTGAYGPKPGGSWIAAEKWKIFPGFANSASGVTTPIAYLSSASAMEDIFRFAHNYPEPLMNQIMYLPSNWYSGDTQAAQERRYGSYVLRSAGPDTYYQNRPDQLGDYGMNETQPWGLASYDSTNGTISNGDIYRSQKDTDEDHI